MRSIDFPIYQRQKEKTQSKEVNLLQKVRRSFPVVSLSLMVLGYAISQITILNGLMPFGISYFAVVLYQKDKKFITPVKLLFILLAVSIGYFMKLDLLAVKYLIAALLVLVLQKYLKDLKIFYYSLFISFSFLICQIPYFDATPTNYISLGAEVIIVLLTTLLALKIMPEVLIYLEDRSKKSKNLLALGVIMGLASVFIIGEQIGGINFLRVLAVYSIMLVALVFGPTQATVVGVIVGFLYNMTHLNAFPLAGSYALAGLIAGNLKKQDKLGVSFGFVISSLLYITFISVSGSIISIMKEALIAGLILILTPRKLLSGLEDLSQEEERSTKFEDDKLESFVTQRVRQFSDIFNELSTAFSEVLPKDDNGTEDVGTFLDLITDKVCVECELCNSCWQQSFYTTYQSLFDLLAIAENRGEVLIDDLEREMSVNCVRKVKLATEINQFVKMYELNHYWESRLYKNKKILLDQLSGMSEVVDNLAEELNISVKPEDEVEQKVHGILEQNGLRIKKVLATNYNNEELELTIRKESCNGEHECIKKILPLLNHKLDYKFDLTWSECGHQLGKTNCLCRLTPGTEYQLKTGVATSSQANNISGDNFTFFNQQDGKFISILSDGMGVGAKASRESESAVRLLEKMLQAGLNYKLALQSVNSILGLRSKEDNFTTVDLLEFNQVTGQAEFIKVGSASSFIKRGNEVSMIKSTTLPIGILNQIDLEPSSLQLKDKDLIIMMSDGVIDSKEGVTIKEEWVLQLLKNNLIDDPQSLAQYILEKAQGNKRIEDDMTVLVIRVDRC
ncbi:stage II sporulation protein E [Halobacteroides halobius DSM 5150]|uniref:Stage II sporulation protein E n=1 Tax=Halobacteroides halobius (strain ATCC 35273 / DSM 5150 / MD-1) TaxID=748449 RepID=L0K4E6_HALHC|nr:stage II sporulation protein E [Halobacteroides halobius]AGB40147.1 stage II sporulation protein E [Halobacteroides halobius DSM 5150]